MENPAPGSRFSRQRMTVSALSIAATTLLLLGILGFSTYRNLYRERILVNELLATQGRVIIEGLQAGARIDMMGMGWSGNRVQWLLEEMAQESHLKFLALVDAQGMVLFHSDKAQVGKPWSPERELDDFPDPGVTRSYRPDKNTLVVTKQFVPLRPGHRRPRMEQDAPMHRMLPDPASRMPLDPLVMAVGLDLTSHNDARRQDLWHAAFMGGLLVLLGGASFLVVLLVQNAYLSRRALEHVRAYYGRVVDSMPNSLIVLGTDDRVATANPAAQCLFGVESDDFKGRGLDALFGVHAAQILHRIRTSGRVLHWEEQALTADGRSIPVSIYGAVVRDPEGRRIGTVLLIQDLREIRELREHAARSQRLAAVGGLAAGVAHEIRNPLSSIRGFSQFFMKKFPQGTRESEYAHLLVQEAERLNRVITALLDFAGSRKPAVRRAPLRDLIEHARTLVQERLGLKGIAFENTCSDLVEAEVDRDQMIQVLLNLFLNAADALDAGGLLRVEATVAEDGGCEIRVSDTGHGMDADTLSRVFDPFFTTKESGMGLGLAVAHRIVEDHGGALTARSDPGRGTTFTIRLPGPGSGSV